MMEKQTPNYHRNLKPMLSELPSVPERLVLKFSLTRKPHENLGITIVGGKGSVNEGIFVKNISLSGVCAHGDSVKVGDQILELNGHDMQEVTHDEAVTLFRRCTSSIDIVVSRMMEIKPQNNISPLSQYHGHVIETSGNGLWEEPFMLEHKTLLSNGD